MNKDIVLRLRRGLASTALLNEAADEIERLRLEDKRLNRALDDIINERDTMAVEIERLRAALHRMVTNVERWRTTGIPADADESKSIYDQMVAALGTAYRPPQRAPV